MKTNLGKPLTKQELKKIQGGKLPGCATIGENGIAYSQGCCVNLSECPTTHLCEPPGSACFGV